MPSDAAEVVVRRVAAGDGPLIRELRLEMVADTPVAFLETLEQARLQPAAEWERRARRGTDGAASATFVAVAGERLLGMMGCYLKSPGEAVLVSVYVTPEHRGGALADRLLAAVLDWARGDAGASRLTLEVNTSNPRACAYYARRGFTDTGVRTPYPLDPRLEEMVMVRELSR